MKVRVTGQRQERKIPSGHSMTAAKMVRGVKRTVKDWEYDVISIVFRDPSSTGAPCMNLTIWPSVGSDLISARHSGVPSRLSMTLPCRRSEAITRAECSFWDSAQGSGRP